MEKFFHKADRSSFRQLVNAGKRKQSVTNGETTNRSLPGHFIRLFRPDVQRTIIWLENNPIVWFLFFIFFFFHLSMIIRVYTYVCTRISSFSLFTISIPLVATSVVSTDCKLLPNRRVASTNSPRRKTKLLSPLNAHRRAVLIESRAVYTTARYSLLIIIYRTRRCWRDLFH